MVTDFKTLDALYQEVRNLSDELKGTEFSGSGEELGNTLYGSTGGEIFCDIGVVVKKILNEKVSDGMRVRLQAVLARVDEYNNNPQDGSYNRKN